MKDLTSHIFHKHQIKASKYKEMFPDAQIRCKLILDQQSKRMSGQNNPWFNHGGTMSPYSKNSKNFDPEIFNRVSASKKKNRKDNTTLEYWTDKANGNRELGEKLLTNRQTTFSKEKCILKYGEEIGIEKWNKRQTKWLKSFSKNNYSKISQELFNSIKKIYDCKNVYYATHERPDMLKYKNKEYRLNLNSRSILPDFIDLEKKKIIEFDGNYWHNQKVPQNPQREKNRDKAIIEMGYEVIHISESDYKKNPEREIQKCINFLN